MASPANTDDKGSLCATALFVNASPAQFPKPRLIEIPEKGRFHQLWKRRPAQIAITVLGIVIVSVVTWWLRADPTIDSANVTFDSVKLGSIDISVLGQGELRSGDFYALSVPFEGVVQRVHAFAGAKLATGQGIITITSGEIDRQLLDAKAALATEESRHAIEVYELNGRRLTQDDELAQQRASRAADKLDLAAMESLLPTQSISRLQYERQRLKTEASEERLRALEESKAEFRDLLKRSLEAGERVLEQRRQMLTNLKERAAGLEMKAEFAGVLLKLAEGIREGQSVHAGQVVAEIARSDRMEALVRVPASRAAEIKVGSRAKISASSGDGEGSVVQIDPEAAAAQVMVTVAIDESLPSGFRPGLPVSVEFPVGREDSVLFIGKPSDARPESSGYLFVRDESLLVRKAVRFGRATTDSIVILSGLTEGDDVAISGIEQFQNSRRLRLRGSVSYRASSAR